MLHAAGGVDEDKTTSCLSIEEQLQRYLLSSGALDPAFLSERKGLVDQLLANPNSVEAWANLLKHEELLFASRPSNCNHKGLVHLYSSAKGLLPEEKKSTPELRGTHEFLWIGYARHTWLDNQEDGQDLFKALKTQPWASKSALFFREWAQLVHQSGDTRKALSLVQKASSQGAEPRSILEELRTQLEAGQGEQQLQVPGRKVQFQDVSTAPTVAGTSAPARRAFPCTPGANAKHDATSSTYSYTGFSGSTSSLSRTGTIGLAGDMSYTMSSSQQHNLTGNISIRSQGSCLSNDEDTSASRAADENRTQESLGGVGTMLQSRGGSGTGTITVPTGFASSLNLAAGAAAVAALGNAPTASNPLGGGGSGGNTGNVSHGLRRFGLRSGIKAVRMTRDETADGGSSGDGGPAGTQVAAAPEASIPATGGQTIRAHRIVAAVESGLKVAEIPAEQLPAQDASAAGALCDGDAAAERGAGAQAKEEVDEVLTRKRRAAEEAAQSPRFVSSVMLQEEGMKRRQSPDNVASTAAPAQPLAAATAQGAAAGSAPTTGVPVASAAGGTDLNTRIGAHLARNGYSTPALSAVSNIALRDPPLGTAPPVPNTPSTNAAVASRQPITSAVAVLSASRAIQMREAARHTQPGIVGSTANAAADQPASVASIRPYASSRQGGACTGGGHAAPSAEPMQTDMDDQENIVPVEAGGSHGHYKEQPLDAAATVPQRVPDAREPPRPVVAHRPVLQAPTPLSAAPVATPLIAPPKPQHPASQQQLPQQHVQDVSRSDQRTHSSGQPQSQAMAFNWPDQLEQPQIRPFDGEQYVYVHGIRYQKLDVAGKGGSSKVFKVLGPNRGIYALKRVQLNNKEREAVQGFIDEITLLRQLRGKPNIIQLIDAQVFRESGLVYMVLEYGDIDLARLLYSHEEARRRAADRESSDGEGGPSSIGSSSCQEIDVNFIRLYWQQMLQAVKCIHDARIVHADLKPANFMLVQGQLKLIDFGIAKAIQGDTTSINRESQVGTLNYMSPEAIQGNGSESAYGGAPLKVGRPSDVWSLGCILYQMIYGRTPFADLQFVAKMRAICDPSYKVPIPECGEPDAVDCISRCLDRNPRTRISLQELLEHPFLHPNRHKASRPPSEGPSGASSGTASLTEEQIKAILQIARAEGNATIDPDSIARRVMQQLNGGDTGPTGSVLTSMPPPAPRNALAPPAPPPPPPTVNSMPRAPAPPLLAATITRAPPAPAPAAPPPPPPPGPAPPPCVGPSAPAPRPVEPLRAPPLPQAQRAATGSGGMGDIAAMAAAAAARRTAKPFAEPVPQPKAVSRPAPYAGAIPLAGAELQAAIVQQRAQLRPVQEQQHTQLSQQRQSNNGTTGKLAGMTPAPGGTATKQQRQDAESGLEVVLRRGLERFRFDDDGDDTHHDSEFMEAAMTAANRQE